MSKTRQDNSYNDIRTNKNEHKMYFDAQFESNFDEGIDERIHIDRDDEIESKDLNIDHMLSNSRAYNRSSSRRKMSYCGSDFTKIKSSNLQLNKTHDYCNSTANLNSHGLRLITEVDNTNKNLVNHSHWKTRTHKDQVPVSHEILNRFRRTSNNRTYSNSRESQRYANVLEDSTDEIEDSKINHKHRKSVVRYLETTEEADRTMSNDDIKVVEQNQENFENKYLQPQQEFSEIKNTDPDHKPIVFL